jgi:hypothetical protein
VLLFTALKLKTCVVIKTSRNGKEKEVISTDKKMFLPY